MLFSGIQACYDNLLMAMIYTAQKACEALTLCASLCSDLYRCYWTVSGIDRQQAEDSRGLAVRWTGNPLCAQ